MKRANERGNWAREEKKTRASAEKKSDRKLLIRFMQKKKIYKQKCNKIHTKKKLCNDLRIYCLCWGKEIFRWRSMFGSLLSVHSLVLCLLCVIFFSLGLSHLRPQRIRIYTPIVSLAFDCFPQNNISICGSVIVLP